MRKRSRTYSVVVGAKSEKTGVFIQDVFYERDVSVYTQPDMIGIELGGSLKKIALAASMLDSMELGDNKAALMTRGILEIIHLGVWNGR